MVSLNKIATTIFSFRKSILPLKGFLVQHNQIRCLFSRRELGIESLENARQDTEFHVPDPFNYKRQFHNNFSENCDFHTFENGLKRLLYVTENSEHDFRVLKNALYTLVQKQRSHKGYKYIFGPTIMRTFYYLDNPTVALEFLEDKEIGQLLSSEITSVHVLMDLLYKNEMYSHVLRVMESTMNKTQSRYLDCLVLAAYYKMNTPEALEEALSYWQKMCKNQEKLPFRKSFTFVAGLAMKHNQPETALKVLEPIFKDFHVTVRQIKLLAWSQIGRIDRIDDMLRTIIKRHTQIKDEFTSVEVLDTIQKSLEGNYSEHKNFLKLRREIESLELVTMETMDDLLCAPFPVKLPSKVYHKKRA